MNIEGRTIRLRAVEPEDADLMYVWENDCDVWAVSGTTEPFSHYQMQRFVERHRDTIGVLGDGQLRRRHPHLRTKRPGPGLRLRRIGSSLPLCTRYAARASAVVQRRGRQRSEPATVPQRGIHRNRRQTRLAMAARRLSRRSDAAKDAGIKRSSLHNCRLLHFTSAATPPRQFGRHNHSNPPLFYNAPPQKQEPV